MAFDSTLDKLKKSLRLHFNWLVYSVAGSEALSSSEIKELKKFKSLPLEEMDFIQKSFFLGRLNSILKNKEYGSIGLSELEEALKSSSLSPVEKLSVKEAQRTAGLHIKTFLSTLEKDLLEQASNANAGLVSQATTLATIQDKVSLALLEKKTWQELAANLSKTFDLDVGRFESLARTELHAAKQKGVTQAIANKVDIFSHSDGVDSNVSVVTHTGRCEDCAALYENADGSPKVFKLSELLANGSNADKSHKRVGSLHGHWKPVVPPTHPNCFPAGTEVLTRSGWKVIESIELDEDILSLNPETKDMEYVPVKHTVNSFSETLLEFSSKNFSLTCTPNHDLLVLTDWQHKNGNKLKRIPAIDVSKSSFLYRSSEWLGVIPDSWNMFGFTPEQFCEFMGYYLSEGSLHPQRGQIDIAQFKPKSKAIMLESLQKMPFKTVSSVQTGIYLKNNELWDYLKQFGISHEKYVPEDIKNLPTKYLEVFLDAFALGDGHRRTPKSWKGANFREELMFFTSSDSLSSDIGELLLKCGYVPSYAYEEPKTVKHRNGVYTSKHGLWNIRRCYNRQASVSYMNITEREHNGLVYCVELEKFNTLYVRQNGKCSWTGNCFCELKYIPPGYAWNGRQLGMIVSKAIGDSKLSATQKPPGPPQAGPKPPPKVGNVPGQAAPARAGGGAPKPPTGSSAKTNAPKKAKPSGPDTSNAIWVPKDKIPEGAQVVKETEHGAYITGGGGNAAKPEEQVHPVQASKDWSKQGHSASTVLDRLKHSELTDVHEMGDGEKGITESYRVSLQDGPRALLKPVAMYDNDTWNSGIQEGDGAQAVPPGTYAKREVAAYHGYNMLGLTDFVPPTTTKEHKGIEHSIQHWQEGFESIHYSIGKGELGKEFVKKHGKEASRGNTEASKILFMALPDDKKEAFMEKYQAGVCAGIIFNHNDQHLGNVIVDAKNWDVKFIDNSMSFGNGMEGCKNEAHMNMHNLGMKLKVPDSLMTKLKNTSLGDVKRALGSHIEDWSVGQTYLRMQYISHLQETEGHLDYEKFKATSGNGMPHDIRPQKPRKAMWGGNDKEPAVKEAIQKEFTRRSKAGLLQNQLFNSFAKQWISDSKKLPDNHPHKIAADELEEIGVFMGDGFIMNPEEYRKSNQHRDFEKTIKPGYPPKDLKSATKIGTSKTIPITRVNNPVVIARDHAAFGVVQTGPDTEDLSSSDLEPFDDEEELGDDDIEVMSSSPGVKTAKQTPHKDEMKTKKSMPRLFISLDGRHGR